MQQQQQQWHARLIGVGELKRTLWYAGHVFSGRSVRIYHHINGYGYGGQAGWYDASRRSHSRSEPSTPDRPVLAISRAVLACLPLRCAPSRPPTPPPDVGVGSGLVGLASLPLLPGRCDATATATAACVHVTLPCRAAACARSLRSPVAVAPLWPLQYCRDPSTHVRHRHSVPRVTGLFSGLSPSAWVLGRAASNKGCQSLGVPAKVASTCVLKKI